VAQLSAMDVYNLLPKANCGACGCKTCMEFATKLVNREAKPEDCPKLDEESLEKLQELLAPPVKELTIGKGDREVTVGGDEVMFRHELSFFNPPPVFVTVYDDMEEDEIAGKTEEIQEFQVERVGEVLKLDGVAVVSRTGDPEKYARAVEIAVERSEDLAVALITTDPEVMEAGLDVFDERPLLYPATEENVEDIAKLAADADCPLGLHARDVEDLVPLVAEAQQYTDDLLLDPGTEFGSHDVVSTTDKLAEIRKAAIEEEFENFGYPTLVTTFPYAFLEDDPVKAARRESYLASACVLRYADLLIMDTVEPWALLPVLTQRQCVYTDPREPQEVEPGLYKIGDPDENSPVLVTTNFTLTYHCVAGDLESADVDCWLLVIDTGGLAVDVSVAGGQFTGEAVKEVIEETGIEDKVEHRVLVIPGKAAAVKGDVEDATGWDVVIGTQDSSELPEFLEKEGLLRIEE